MRNRLNMPNLDKIQAIENILAGLKNRLKSCDICPRGCKVNRLNNQKGYCQTGSELTVYTAFLHKGEEPSLIGEKGSGTIFFSGCNLRCLYCQNYKFSQELAGKVISPQECANIMLNLEKMGAANINLVTPTHILPQLLEALILALKTGLSIPLVYNTSGYEKKGVISLLNPIVDVYLADLRYTSKNASKAYSEAENYPIFNQEALLEMARQKTNKWQDDQLLGGLIIRHLVLPGHIKETEDALNWIITNIKNPLVSIMFQYQPYYKAKNTPINRPINQEEYNQTIDLVERLEIDGWVQQYPSRDNLAGVYFTPLEDSLLRF